METHPLLQVDKVPVKRKQTVPRVEKTIDDTTRTTTTKRKQVWRVEKNDKSTKPKEKVKTTTVPIVNQTRAKKAKTGSIAS